MVLISSRVVRNLLQEWHEKQGVPVLKQHVVSVHLRRRPWMHHTHLDELPHVVVRMSDWLHLGVFGLVPQAEARFSARWC